MTARITWPTMRYGYKIVDDEILPEPTEQHILREITRLTKANKSSGEIAETLNTSGYRTRNKTLWTGSHIRNLWHRRGKPTTSPP